MLARPIRPRLLLTPFLFPLTLFLLPLTLLPHLTS
jgi:hypothetical protein